MNNSKHQTYHSIFKNQSTANSHALNADLTSISKHPPKTASNIRNKQEIGESTELMCRRKNENTNSKELVKAAA